MNGRRKINGRKHTFHSNHSTIVSLKLINENASFLSFLQQSKVFPKHQMISTSPATLSRQDTIDETTEDSKSLRRKTLEKQISERDGPMIERASSFERDSATGRGIKTTDTSGLREQISVVQRDLIATVHDIKVESKHEMQRMNQRIGRLEDLLTEVLKRLPHADSSLSTPAEDTIPTITTTFVESPTSTKSVVHSPTTLANISSASVPIPSTSGNSIALD